MILYISASNLNTPVAVTDSVIFPMNQPFFFNVLNNDTDGDGDDLQVTDVHTTDGSLLAPSLGSVLMVSNGLLLYIPNAGAVGMDSLEYRVCDDGCISNCSVGIVYLEIINQPPFAQNDSRVIGMNTTESISSTSRLGSLRRRLAGLLLQMTTRDQFRSSIAHSSAPRGFCCFPPRGVSAYTRLANHANA